MIETPEKLQAPSLRQLIPPDELSLEAYHASEGLSSTTLKQMLLGTPHAARMQQTQPPEPTYAMRMGTLLHLAVLEPERFKREVLIKPKFTGVGAYTKARELVEAHPGKTLIEQSEADMVMQGVKAINASPFALSLVKHPQAVKEHSIFFEDAQTGLLCKARPDLFIVSGRHLVIADVKKTVNASERAFGTQAHDLLYTVSAAHYINAMRTLYPQHIVSFYWIAVETQTEQCAVYEMTPEQHRKGNQKLRQAIDTYAACIESNQWPSYQPDGRPQFLFTPKWA